MTSLPSFTREAEAMAQFDPEIMTINEKSTAEFIVITKNFLEIWKGKSRIPPNRAEAAAVVIQRTIEEIIHTALFSNIHTPTHQLINELVEMLYRYLYED